MQAKIEIWKILSASDAAHHLGTGVTGVHSMGEVCYLRLPCFLMKCKFITDILVNTL